VGKPRRRPAAVQARRERFADEYLIDLNGKAAAIRAGAAPRSAAVTASRWLADPDVQALLRVRRERLIEKTQVSQERIVNELAAVGFANLKDIVRWTETEAEVRPSDELSRELTAALSEVAIDQETLEWEGEPAEGEKALEAMGLIAEAQGRKAHLLRRKIRVKMHPKLDALMDLVKVLGYEKEKTPVGAGVAIYVAGGPTGLEVRAVAAAGAGQALPPPPTGAGPVVELGGGDG
jgi:phage terminase small subunit